MGAILRLKSIENTWARNRIRTGSLLWLYLGSVSQKYRALAARTAPVCFLTIPFSALEFGEAIRHAVCR